MSKYIGKYRTELSKEQMKSNLLEACDKHLFPWSTYAIKWFGHRNSFLLKANSLTFTDFEAGKRRLSICVRIRAKIKCENGETCVELKEGMPAPPLSICLSFIIMLSLMIYIGYSRAFNNELIWQVGTIILPVVLSSLIYGFGHFYTNMTSEGYQAKGYTVDFLERCLKLNRI